MNKKILLLPFLSLTLTSCSIKTDETFSRIKYFFNFLGDAISHIGEKHITRNKLKSKYNEKGESPYSYGLTKGYVIGSDLKTKISLDGAYDLSNKYFNYCRTEYILNQIMCPINDKVTIKETDTFYEINNFAFVYPVIGTYEEVRNLGINGNYDYYGNVAVKFDQYFNIVYLETIAVNVSQIVVFSRFYKNNMNLNDYAVAIKLNVDWHM